MRRIVKAALAAAFVVTLVVVGLGALSGPPRAPAADPTVRLLPPAGSVYTGVSSGAVGSFTNEVGKHPAVYGEFVTWGQSIHFAFNQAAAAHARLMLHIGTGALGHGVITPEQIAQGRGDAYLLTLSQLIAGRRQPVYIRLMAEMNNANNPYCAINQDGSSRGPAYTPTEFIAAWRRVVTVLRGGFAATIDAKLAALGQPRLHGIAAAGSVASSPIAFVWTPETAGTPNVPSNSAATYYPGNAYVDWVGTDFYSKFPNFAGLDTFYKEFKSKPFVFAEWAIWGGDNPAFVNQFFAWVNTHKRVDMIIYNQGFTPSGPFSLTADPQSAAAIRGKLAPARYIASAAS
jgi:hypothetical protein